MKTITMTELRAEPGERIREAQKHGRSILITKGGKPAAKLVPVSDTTVIFRDGTIFGGVPLTAQINPEDRHGEY